MRARKAGQLALQYLALFSFWLVLSGRFQLKYLIFGALSAGLVTFLTQDLFSAEAELARGESKGVRFWVLPGWRLFLYIIWLIFEIIKANLQVAYLVLHPKMLIEPNLLRFRTRLRSGVGHIILANSITLTPGTITVDFRDGTYLVHALVPQAARSLLDAKMPGRLEAIFGEDVEGPAPEMMWVREDRGLGP